MNTYCLCPTSRLLTMRKERKSLPQGYGKHCPMYRNGLVAVRTARSVFPSVRSKSGFLTRWLVSWNFCAVGKKQQKKPDKNRTSLLRRQDSNMRPPGYEPGELPTAPLRDVKPCIISNASAKVLLFFELAKQISLYF